MRYSSALLLSVLLLLSPSCSSVTPRKDASPHGKPLSLKGTVSTLAGESPFGHIDGTGSAARFKGPSGLSTDGKHLYVADWGNSTIRKIE